MEVFLVYIWIYLLKWVKMMYLQRKKIIDRINCSIQNIENDRIWNFYQCRTLAPCIQAQDLQAARLGTWPLLVLVSKMEHPLPCVPVVSIASHPDSHVAGRLWTWRIFKLFLQTFYRFKMALLLNRFSSSCVRQRKLWAQQTHGFIYY